jgi:hypothetical protein
VGTRLHDGINGLHDAHDAHDAHGARGDDDASHGALDDGSAA